MTDWDKWRGLKALVHDGVNGASRAVERVQKETASRWFGLLEAVPPLGPPVRVVRALHDGTTAAVHGAIRLTNGLVAAGAGGLITALEAVDAKKRPTDQQPPTEHGPLRSVP